MNNDLISRNALLHDLRDKGFLPAFVQRAIERAPAVDAVEVARCRECCHLENGYRCRTPLGAGLYNGEYILVDPEDDFCSYGEPKEAADNG